MIKTLLILFILNCMLLDLVCIFYILKNPKFKETFELKVRKRVNKRGA